MTLKQIFWTPPQKTEEFSFLYFQTNNEIWWSFKSILAFCAIKLTSGRVLEKYNLSAKPLSELNPQKSFLPKNTLFVSLETTLAFLNQWNQTEKKLDEITFCQLQEVLTNPTGTDMKKPERKQKKEKTRVFSNRAEYEKDLIEIVRTSLTLALTAQDFLCKQKPVQLTDIELLKEYNVQVKEYIEGLPIQTESSRNNFIDIEVLES